MQAKPPHSKEWSSPKYPLQVRKLLHWSQQELTVVWSRMLQMEKGGDSLQSVCSNIEGFSSIDP